MYAINVKLGSDPMAQLLALRNDYRALHGGKLPTVLLSMSDYNELRKSYPVDHYGNVVHDMPVLVVSTFETQGFVAPAVVQMSQEDETEEFPPLIEEIEYQPRPTPPVKLTRDNIIREAAKRGRKPKARR